MWLLRSAFPDRVDESGISAFHLCFQANKQRSRIGRRLVLAEQSSPASAPPASDGPCRAQVPPALLCCLQLRENAKQAVRRLAEVNGVVHQGNPTTSSDQTRSERWNKPLEKGEGGSFEGRLKPSEPEFAKFLNFTGSRCDDG